MDKPQRKWKVSVTGPEHSKYQAPMWKRGPDVRITGRDYACSFREGETMSVLQFLSVIGSVAAFLVSAWKYFDTRKFESKTKRFEQYRLVCMWLAGRTESGIVLVDIHQAIAAYQLAEFPEYWGTYPRKVVQG